MLPKKRQRETSEKVAKAAKGNAIRGSGTQSRIALDLDKLREAGWMIKQEERELSSGVKVYLRYRHPGGKTLKGAKDVEWQLRDEGVLETFKTTKTIVNAKQEQKSTTDSSHNDSDYKAPLKELREETNSEW